MQSFVTTCNAEDNIGLTDILIYNIEEEQQIITEIGIIITTESIQRG